MPCVAFPTPRSHQDLPSIYHSIIFVLCSLLSRVCSGKAMLPVHAAALRLLGVLFKVSLSKVLALTFTWLAYGPGSLCKRRWFCRLCEYILVLFLQLF